MKTAEQPEGVVGRRGVEVTGRLVGEHERRAADERAPEACAGDRAREETLAIPSATAIVTNTSISVRELLCSAYSDWA